MGTQVTYGLLGPFSHGRGYQKLIPSATPTVGTNFTHTVPGDAWERLIALAFTLTTDSNAANRIVTVAYADQSGHTFTADGSGVLVTASTTAQQFYGSNQRGTSEWQTPGPIFFPLWGGFLQSGYKVTITVGNIQAGDQLDSIVAIYEKFETGDAGYPLGGMDSDVFRDWRERLGD